MMNTADRSSSKRRCLLPNPELKTYFENFCQDLHPDTPTEIMEGIRNDLMMSPKDECGSSLNTPVLTTDESIDLRKFWLSQTLCVSIQVFKGQLYIHIREYYLHPQSYDMLPSKIGVALDVETFYHFGRQLFNFSHRLNHPSDSTIVNNNLLCVISNNVLTLKKFNPYRTFSSQIQLNTSHLANLRECLSEIDDFVINYMYTEQLPKAVCANHATMTHESAITDLVNIIQSDLQQSIKGLVRCSACDFATDYRHSCENIDYPLQFKTLLPSVKLLLNVNAVAEQFLSQHDPISFHRNDFMTLQQKLFV